MFAGNIVAFLALGPAALIPAEIVYIILIASVLSADVFIGITATIFMHIAYYAQTLAGGGQCAQLPGLVTFAVSDAIPIFDSILPLSAAIFIS